MAYRSWTCRIDEENIWDRAHDEGEESYAKKLNEHIKCVLLPCEPFHVTVADSGQCGYRPIESRDVVLLIIYLVAVDNVETWCWMGDPAVL